MANPYQKYTGARVQPVPAGYLQAYGNVGAMYSKGLAGLGEGIGEAIGKYYKGKEERATLEGEAVSLVNQQQQSGGLINVFTEKEQATFADGLSGWSLPQLRAKVGGKKAEMAMQLKLLPTRQAQKKATAEKTAEAQTMDAWRTAHGLNPEVRISGYLEKGAWGPEGDVVHKTPQPDTVPHAPYLTTPAEERGEASAEEVAGYGHPGMTADVAEKLWKSMHPEADGEHTAAKVQGWNLFTKREDYKKAEPEEQAQMARNYWGATLDDTQDKTAMVQSLEYFEKVFADDPDTLKRIQMAQGGLGSLANKQGLYDFMKANRGDLSDDDLARVLAGQKITDKTQFRAWKTGRIATWTDEDKARWDKTHGVQTEAELATDKVVLDKHGEDLKLLQHAVSTKQDNFETMALAGRVVISINAKEEYVLTSPSSGFVRKKDVAGVTVENPSVTMGRWVAANKELVRLQGKTDMPPGVVLAQGKAVTATPWSITGLEKNSMTMLGHQLMAMEHQMGRTDPYGAVPTTTGPPVKPKGAYLDWTKVQWRGGDDANGSWQVHDGAPVQPGAAPGWVPLYDQDGNLNLSGLSAPAVKAILLEFNP